MNHARFILAEGIKVDGRFVPSHHIDIEDDEGRVLDTIRFGEVVKISSR